MRAVFGGKTYRIASQAKLPKGDLGECDYKKGVIRIPIDGDTLPELDWICHEAIHAECPWMDEWAVDLLARRLSRFLWRLGWRKE